jgi:hypothetical protein
MDKHEVGVPGENANTRKVEGADRATSAASTPTGPGGRFGLSFFV